MKVAIIAIAKDEDPYAEEWLDYHFRLGIDDIYMVQHGGWKYSGRRFPGLKNCFAGWHSRQDDVCNDWLRECRDLYDWILFIDVDEFICLKNGDNNIKEFLARYDDCNGICFNWRFFGDSGRIEDGDYRVVERFVRCSSELCTWVKIALHASRAPKDSWLANIHSLMIGKNKRDRIIAVPRVYNTAKLHCQERLCESPYDLSECMSIAYLAHYRNKTYGEWYRRVHKSHGLQLFPGVAGVPAEDFADSMALYRRYLEANCNESEELALRNFQRTGSFL